MLDPEGGSLLGNRWPKLAGRLGKRWRKQLEKCLAANPNLLFARVAPAEDSWPNLGLPKELDRRWGDLRSHAFQSLAEMAPTGAFCRSLLELCLLADEASAGIGFESDGSYFLVLGALRLISNDSRSVAWSVPPEKAAVLPKQHTPQRGLTLRSLSHHLALCPAGEVEAAWRIPHNLKKGESLDIINLLLLPWPLELTAKDFNVMGHRSDLALLPESYRYFTFRRQPGGELRFEHFLQAAIEQARNFVGRVHAIVLPELALTFTEYLLAERIAYAQKALLIAGVGCRDGDGPFKAESNVCMVQPAGLTLSDLEISDEMLERQRLLQRKHHRWCLDRKQILQYGLGGIIPASKGCWEFIEVSHYPIFGGLHTFEVPAAEAAAPETRPR